MLCCCHLCNKWNWLIWRVLKVYILTIWVPFAGPALFWMAYFHPLLYFQDAFCDHLLYQVSILPSLKSFRAFIGTLGSDRISYSITGLEWLSTSRYALIITLVSHANMIRYAQWSRALEYPRRWKWWKCTSNNLRWPIYGYVLTSIEEFKKGSAVSLGVWSKTLHQPARNSFSAGLILSQLVANINTNVSRVMRPPHWQDEVRLRIKIYPGKHFHVARKHWKFSADMPWMMWKPNFLLICLLYSCYNRTESCFETSNSDLSGECRRW